LRDKKKNSEQKKKIPFSDLRFFYLSRGEEKEKRERNQERKNKRKSNTLTGQIVIYLVRALPGRERVLLFINRGKSPLFYKKQYQK